MILKIRSVKTIAIRRADYIEILHKVYTDRRTKKPAYSVRSFARDLKVSPSSLSEILSGRKGISESMAVKLAKQLNIPPLQSERLVLSAVSEHARSKSIRDSAKARLLALEAATQNEALIYTMVNWVTAASYRYLQRLPLAGAEVKIAKLLDVPQFMVANSIRFLTRIGFVEKAPKKKAFLASVTKGKKLNIDYEQILERARWALSREQRFDQDFSFEALFLSSDQIELAKSILFEAKKKIEKLQSEKTDAKLYFVATQLYTVERD